MTIPLPCPRLGTTDRQCRYSAALVCCLANASQACTSPALSTSGWGLVLSLDPHLREMAPDRDARGPRFSETLNARPLQRPFQTGIASPPRALPSTKWFPHQAGGWAKHRARSRSVRAHEPPRPQMNGVRDFQQKVLVTCVIKALQLACNVISNQRRCE